MALRDAGELIEPRVRASLDALLLSPADDGLVAVALMQARTLDEMDAGMRAKMCGQVSGALLASLKELQARSRAIGEAPLSTRLQVLRDNRAATDAKNGYLPA